MLAIAITFVLVPLAATAYLFNTYNLFSDVPGPFLARFSDLWRLLSVYHRDAHDVQQRLHKEARQATPSHPASDIVRLGPKNLSVSGPNYIPQIYGIDRAKKMRKSDFYAVFQNIVNGRRSASLVAMTDEAEHAKTKRLVAHAYSLTNLVDFEPLVDRTTEVLLEQMGKRFGDPENHDVCDLGRWIQFYAFDVIGELTFSKRLGFIESGEDVSNIIRSINSNFEYFSVIGQMPWLDEWLGKNPLYTKFFAKPVSSPILKFAQTLLKERLSQLEAEKAGEVVDTSSGEKVTDKPDFLARFLQVRTNPELAADDNDAALMSDGQLMAFLFANINAGSDTIASTLRAVFYHLLKNPASLATLMTELRTAQASGHLTLPCPTWQETQSEHCTYLRAVVKEAVRMNPALSLPLERVVGSEGLTLTSTPSKGAAATAQTSRFIPGGTVVGINPYVLHRDPRVFDPNGASDPETWEPLRWIAPSSPPSSACATPTPTPSVRRPRADTTTTEPDSDSETRSVSSRGSDLSAASATGGPDGQTPETVEKVSPDVSAAPPSYAAFNTAEQVKTMDHSIMTFGAGKRSCLGKNIAMMELQKLVPALLMRFDLQLAHPDRDWEVKNAWVLAQTGLEVTVSERP